MRADIVSEIRAMEVILSVDGGNLIRETEGGDHRRAALHDPRT
jgi:hypothetical protein